MSVGPSALPLPSSSFYIPKAGPEKKTVNGSSLDYQIKSDFFMSEDLARSGLLAEDLRAYPDSVRVIGSFDQSYVIPYWNLDGKPIVSENGGVLMYRRRGNVKPGYEKTIGKYIGPKIEEAGGYGNWPYIHPWVWNFKSAKVLNICEGEKKSACVMKMAGLPAIGIPGKDVGKDCEKIIVQAVVKMGVSEVHIWPDADVVRYDVRRSYGVLVSRLAAELPNVLFKVMRPGWDKKYKGIDDALVAGTSWDEVCSGGELKELPESPSALAEQLGLQFKTTEKGGVVLYENEYNISKLLASEGLWGCQFWLDTDRRRLMLGSSELRYNIDSIGIAGEFQYRLDMKMIPRDKVWNCVIGECEKKEKSEWAEWLGGLVWDGEKRLENWLSKYCGADPADSYVSEVGEKFLCSVVARTMKPGTAVDWMLITYGAQGCGKSSLVRALVGEPWAHLVKNAPHTQDKDLLMAMASCRIVNFDEMALFFKRVDNTEFIKGLVTATHDIFRPPYGRESVSADRGCVLYGTTNDPKAIKRDDSGYRRWCVVSVRGVIDTQYGPQFDWKGIEEAREQLWAEAVALYRKGIDVSQVRGASTRAAQHVQDNPVEEQIIDALSAWLNGGMRNAGDRFRSPNGGDKKNGLWLIPSSELGHMLGWGTDEVRRMRFHTAEFWHKWGCEEYRSGGVRYRVISSKLEDYCVGAAG